jgi:hypothetical protein
MSHPQSPSTATLSTVVLLRLQQPIWIRVSSKTSPIARSFCGVERLCLPSEGEVGGLEWNVWSGRSHDPKMRVRNEIGGRVPSRNDNQLGEMVAVGYHCLLFRSCSTFDIWLRRRSTRKDGVEARCSVGLCRVDDDHDA